MRKNNQSRDNLLFILRKNKIEQGVELGSKLAFSRRAKSFFTTLMIMASIVAVLLQAAELSMIIVAFACAALLFRVNERRLEKKARKAFKEHAVILENKILAGDNAVVTYKQEIEISYKEEEAILSSRILTTYMRELIEIYHLSHLIKVSSKFDQYAHQTMHPH